MRVRFALISEGSSDRGLVGHLEESCRRAGATEVQGDAPDLGRLPVRIGKAVADQVQAILRFEPGVDFFFIHRDADEPDDTTIREVIDRGVSALESGAPPHVKVVPIQELEAWLLLDEAEIRHVAGHPRGKQELNLPPVRSIETTTSPKERLEHALIAASGLSGHRLVSFKKRLPALRSTLLQRLDLDGPIQNLSAWRKLVTETREVVESLSRARSNESIP
jgi:hypothetical protein